MNVVVPPYSSERTKLLFLQKVAGKNEALTQHRLSSFPRRELLVSCWSYEGTTLGYKAKGSTRTS